MPKISVIMPVFNGEKYLAVAIKSILCQTEKDFEFIIINDYSTDNSLNIIKSFNDPRIILLNNSRQMRITASLNKGIKIAKGKYIARMDSDDISMPTRLETEAAFLDTHPDVGITGSWVQGFGRHEGLWKYPTDPKLLKANLLFNTSICHPSVMMRAGALRKFKLRYNEKFPNAQDYELWSRAADFFTVTNIPRVLLHYRLHPRQEGVTFHDKRAKLVEKIRRSLLVKLGIKPSREELQLHSQLATRAYLQDDDFINFSERWLGKILATNQKTHRYDPNKLQTVLIEKWFDVCRAKNSRTRFLKSSILANSQFPWKKALILTLFAK